MRTKRRALLTVCCLLAATLGTQLALGQEQPQKPPAETQADEAVIRPHRVGGLVFWWCALLPRLTS